ncbi:GDSL-type esterase/lipase family protein [Paraburkholderia caffeinilytica]|uniref:GDSL-type esterase/lipase family protein n=1 Tax=Paraburkholderia caffeinilytica TaxID=1761016 RepID=UPI0038BB623D
MSRLWIVLLVAFCGALTVASLIIVRLAVPDLFRRAPSAVAAGPAVPSGRIRLAVLGDSDSQSYHDTLMLGDPHMRGGPRRATTWQWTEILARLRGDQIDLGEWGVWGTGKYRAYLDEALGFLSRTPPKYDYRYNFAVSGAICNQLMGHPLREALRLVDLMDTEPQAWRGGIVLIRIGTNDVGGPEILDELARDRNASRPAALIDACIGAIGEAVALIRKQHPDTYVVLVGLLSDVDGSDSFDRWQSARQIANIDAGMDRFDNGLRKLAAADRHVCFLDDRAWFRGLWGTRDDEGRPRYKTVHLLPGWAITNTSGDDPHNAGLSDGHAGVVWNALWTQHLVASLNDAFGLHLKPITDSEVIDFLQPSFAASTRSDSSLVKSLAK